MRQCWERSIGAGLIAGVLALAAGPLIAQQGSPASAFQTDPRLNAADQLAPSQMNQAMPDAVAEPTPKPHRAATRARHAAADPPAGTAVPAGGATPPARRPPPPPRTTTVACSGPFAKDSSMLGLAMAFDSRNVIFTEVTVSGSQVAASILFPKDPKRRLEIWWSNPGSRSGVFLILINGQSTWTGPGGLRLGLNLAQLEKLNHKPFKLRGFDKDQVASVNDWDGGALSTLPGGCKNGVSLRADPKASAEAVSALPADHDYNSADPAVRAVKPTVSEILIGY